MATNLREEFQKVRNLTHQSAATGVGMVALGTMTALSSLFTIASSPPLGVTGLALGVTVGAVGCIYSRRYRKAADEVMEKAIKDVESSASQPIEQFRVPDEKNPSPPSEPK